MSDNILDDLIEFLQAASLSTYAINAFLAVVQSSQINWLTAREISTKSHVPSGRIYEVLDDLRSKGMIEVIESRPKKYQSVTLNKALDNLMTHQTNEYKKKSSFLYQQAKIIETKLYDTNVFIKKEPSKIFWSSVFGTQPIFSLYKKYLNELQSELLLIGFINENTEKIYSDDNFFFEGIRKVLKRGVCVKVLFTFGFDDRPLSDDQENTNKALFNKIKEKIFKLNNLNPKIHHFEMKFIYKKIPTHYDIFDKRRIIFKLQNPIKPWQIFACMNVVDPTLSEELREKFNNMWTFEAIG